jgi:hypothetical protein
MPLVGSGELPLAPHASLKLQQIPMTLQGTSTFSTAKKGHLDTESIGLTPRSGYLIRLASSSGVLLLCRARYFYYVLINGLCFSTMFFFSGRGEHLEMDAYFQ